MHLKDTLRPYVKPYVRRSKTDAADAEAICEAVSRPNMRFVPVKSTAQQAALLHHRTRDLLVRQRTMLINALRGHLAGFDIVAPVGRYRVGDLLGLLLEATDAEVPALAREALRSIMAELESNRPPPAPFHPIARGRAGPELLAMILEAKFGQHLPLNRQSEAYAREDIHLDVSTMADWVGACTAALAPLVA